jgi:preprotein translocase subunit SecG
MTILLTILHVIVCALLVLAVLLQSGKGGGLAGAIGGGMSSSSVLGGRTATTFLSKATTVLAVTFMLSCLVQAIIVRSANTEPTTAAERAMQSGEMPPMTPFGADQGGLLDEPAAEEATGSEAASGEATESPE